MSVHELNPQYARVISLHRVTIRYLLMFVHRRDVEQSSVSRTFAGDRVWVCYTKSHLCTLPSFASLIKYKTQ